MQPIETLKRELSAFCEANKGEFEEKPPYTTCKVDDIAVTLDKNGTLSIDTQELSVNVRGVDSISSLWSDELMTDISIKSRDSYIEIGSSRGKSKVRGYVNIPQLD